MYLNYIPVLIMQIILSLAYIMLRRRNLAGRDYWMLLTANLSIAFICLYIVPFPVTDIRFFSVTPSFAIFPDHELTTMEWAYLVAPIALLTILLCSVFERSKAYKGVLIAVLLSMFVQFLEFAIQSDRAQVSYIVIQAAAAIPGYWLCILLHNNTLHWIPLAERSPH